MKRYYFKILFLLTAACSTVGAQTTPTELKTDSVARKAIHFLNSNAPDSIYDLAGEAFKNQISPVLWKNVFANQLTPLVPFNETTFISSADGINKYKLEGKQTITFLISLDEKQKMQVFLFQPYQAEKTPAVMNPQEAKTDSLARKVLGLINRKQADSVYAFAGSAFKSKIDLTTWKIISESSLFPLTPLTPAVFTGSKNGVNQYKVNNFLFSLSLDQENKFSTLLLQPYPQEQVKGAKVLSDNPMKTRLDSTVNRVVMEYMQTKGHVGLSAGLSYKGSDHFYNYGETSLGNAQIPSVNTLYDIGSITKTFTSTLLAIAVYQKKVTLDTPITKFLPDSVARNPALKNITLKMLANHTSGLPRLPDNLGQQMTDPNQPYEHYETAHLFSFLKDLKTTKKPGTAYEYSNLGAGLLGVLLEKIVQKPYGLLLDTYILRPAKLGQTFLKIKAADQKLVAQGYDENNKPVPMWLFSALQAAGGLKSSSADLLSYGKWQLSTADNPLAKAVRLTHEITFDDGRTVMGLGWHLLPENKAVIQHTGGTGGYRTFIGAHLQRKLTVAVLTNSATGGDALGIKLLQAVENLP
jgi:CubicO group peptidase (beta-lactamase class C family)